MKGSPIGQVTQILQEWNQGDKTAPARLMPLVYDELRRLARSYLCDERADHTLQATALVHEAYLRMVDTRKIGGTGRAQFYGAAARMMRRILVEHARAAAAQKRGAESQKVYLDETRELAQEQAPDVIEVDAALEDFASIYPRKSEVVELKFFGGLSTREISEVLQISQKTVLRDWNFARLWLSRELRENVARER